MYQIIVEVLKTDNTKWWKGCRATEIVLHWKSFRKNVLSSTIAGTGITSWYIKIYYASATIVQCIICPRMITSIYGIEYTIEKQLYCTK